MVEINFRDRTEKNTNRTRSSLFAQGNQDQVRTSQSRARDLLGPSVLQAIVPDESQTFSSRLAQQDADIEKLYQDIDLLGDKVLALERSLIELRTELRMSSMIVTGSGQDVLIDGFETMLGAMKGARSASKNLEDLRAENERLKQHLRTNSAPITDEVDRPTSETGKAEAPSAPRVAPTKKKRPYTRRKRLATQKSVTPAAIEMSDPDSSLVSNHDQEDASHLDSLAALSQITAALGEPVTANQAQILTDNDTLGQVTEDNANGPSEPSHSLGNCDNQQKKRQRPREEVITDGGVPGSYQRKKRTSIEADDSGSTNNHFEQPDHEQQLIASILSLPESDPHQSLPAQLHNAALDFDIATTDEMAIDPALRSTSVRSIQLQPPQNVLSSIANPPDKKSNEQQEKTGGELQYDSIHEARIREYKARDALRKRKSRAASSEKKKMQGDDKFKQDEKIKARERMVKELMEREEMLENDDDL